jgi:hypothetical protein
LPTDGQRVGAGFSCSRFGPPINKFLGIGKRSVARRLPPESKKIESYPPTHLKKNFLPARK